LTHARSQHQGHGFCLENKVHVPWRHTSKWSESFRLSWLIFSEKRETGSRMNKWATCWARAGSIPPSTRVLKCSFS
jgi:hypothetical protein